MFQVKSIPTRHTPSMNIEFQLMSLPCHFHNQPFHVHYMPRIIQVRHSQLIHPLTHAYSIPSCHYIIIQSNTSQTSKNRENAKPERTLAQLFAQAKGSRSSERVSRSGESSTHRNSGLCAFSLRRDSPRLSETLARSKLSWSPERPLAWKGLGESLLISPRRDRLAWAILSDLATIFLQQPPIPKPNQTNMLKRSKHSQHHANHRLLT